MKKHFGFFNKMIPKKAVIIILICNATIIMAETNENPYRIGASLGYSFTGYREETYSSVNRYLNTLTFLLDGNIEKNKFLHSFNIGFYMGNSTIDAEEVFIDHTMNHQTGDAYYAAILPRFLAIRGYLEYALDYRLWGNDTFPGYLGGSFRADAYLQFGNYPSITGLVSLDIHATQKWVMNNENSFILSLGFPIFGYAVRPPYAGADAAIIKYASEQPMMIITMGEITSFHNYWAVFGDLKYHHKVNSLITLHPGLGFELSRINFPRPRIDGILRLSGGISFTF